jgi:hypothetical protein
MEVEMEVENPDGTAASEPIVTIEEVEEVVLVWEDSDNGQKQKSIEELAKSVTEHRHLAVVDMSEDTAILEYLHL